MPYLEDEGVFARFRYQPLGLSFKFDTESVDVVEEVGLLDRLKALLFSDFAEGVKIKKLRTGKRSVAGLKGEETILKMTEKNWSDGETSEFQFTWEYVGQKDSGDFPEIQITMTEIGADNYDEKLAIWDAILDTIRPIGR